MPTPRRDDFRADVKAKLAQRVGYLCSYCQKATVGPRMGEEGALNLGTAAHIKAASPGGPRYDATQTPAERSHIDNGIWLCNNHAHMIDHDPKEYTVEVLQKWKAEGERRALEQLLSGTGPATVHAATPELIASLQGVAARLALPAAADLPTVKADALAAAQAHAETFEATRRWPRHAVSLSLALDDSDIAHGPVSLERLPQVLMAARKMALFSAPGTGKSTTMVQLAKLMTGDAPVPLLVPLGEWAETGADLLTWIAARHAFGTVTVKHLQFLAFHGEVALLLDGWNEVPPAARRRLITEVQALEREYPLLHLVMSSRRQAIDVPFAGQRFSVLPLSLSQQTEIARAVNGESGASVVDAAWRAPGLSELVSVPLYLWSLLDITDGGALPANKEELLRRMVATHEADPTRAELFHRELADHQQGYLRALASAAQQAETTSLKEDAALKVVGAVNVQLRDAGLVVTPPNAAAVLDTLVAAHVLVREGGPVYAFQHQQIQEWFASLDLEDELRAAAGTLNLQHPLVSGKLDDYFWGEAFLFACERMSRANDSGAQAVAELIDLLLKIDPLFAATLINRSAPAVWDRVSAAVSAFARAWHKPGVPDRAVGFMVATGRPEFGDVVWALVSSTDQHVQSESLRLVRRFNPAAIAEPLFRDYGGLADDVREGLAAGLAFDGDRAGIDAALQLALTEKNTAIRYRVFGGLSFRGATGQADELLRQSGDALADEVARRGYVDGIGDEAILADIMERKRRLVAVNPKPENRLGRALHDLPDAEIPAVIEETLADAGFSFRDHGASVMHEVAGRFPELVGAALKRRAERKQTLPSAPSEYMAVVEPTYEAPISDLVLRGEPDDHARAAAYLAGPATVKALVERYLAAGAKYRADGDRAAYEPVRTLSDLLAQTRASVLFDVVIGYGDNLAPDVINDLAGLISGHGRPAGEEQLALPEELRRTTANRLVAWARRVLHGGADRSVMGKLTWAMRRLPEVSQVAVLADMLAADLRIRSEAAEAFAADRSDRQALQVLRTSHNWDYRNALVKAGGAEAEAVLTAFVDDDEFGVDAAIGLQLIWQRTNEPARDDRFQQWPEFDRVAANRARDQRAVAPAAAIFAAAERAAGQGDPTATARAIRLAGAGVLLPHSDQKALLEKLMAAEADSWGKLELAQRIVVSGVVLSADLALAALRQAIELHGEGNWIDENELGVLIHWLELLPMTDRPDSLFEGIDLVFRRFKAGEWRLRDILRPLAFVDEQLRVDLLRRLVGRFPELTGQHEFYRTLSVVGAQTLDLLTDIAAGRLGKGNMRNATRHDYARQLYNGLTPELRGSLPGRFAEARDDGGKVFLGQILAESEDLDAILMLMADPAGRKIMGSPYRISQDLIYTRQPLDEHGTSYALVARDVARLRAGLFDPTAAADQRVAAFAAACLTEVDATRDREDSLGTGNRHPRLASGRAWPDVSSVTSAVASG